MLMAAVSKPLAKGIAARLNLLEKSTGKFVDNVSNTPLFLTLTIALFGAMLSLPVTELRSIGDQGQDIDVCADSRLRIVTRGLFVSAMGIEGVFLKELFGGKLDVRTSLHHLNAICGINFGLYSAIYAPLSAYLYLGDAVGVVTEWTHQVTLATYHRYAGNSEAQARVMLVYFHIVTLYQIVFHMAYPYVYMAYLHDFLPTYVKVVWAMNNGFQCVTGTLLSRLAWQLYSRKRREKPAPQPDLVGPPAIASPSSQPDSQIVSV